MMYTLYLKRLNLWPQQTWFPRLVHGPYEKAFGQIHGSSVLPALSSVLVQGLEAHREYVLLYNLCCPFPALLQLSVWHLWVSPSDTWLSFVHED